MRSAALIALLLLLPACRAFDDAAGTGEELKTVEISQPVLPGGKVSHPDHGDETWFAIGAMAGTNGVPANGVAESHVFADGATIASVRLNIAVAPEGTFYEAWLRGSDGAETSLGHLTNPFGDVRHQARLETADDLRGRMDVLVTLERDDGNPQRSGQTVATGALKETRRP